MPKAPVTARTLHWTRLDDSTITVVDWYTVTTSLGAMVESRTTVHLVSDMNNEDLYDTSVSEVALIASLPTGNYALDQLAYGSVHQWPHYRASDPGVDMP